MSNGETKSAATLAAIANAEADRKAALAKLKDAQRRLQELRK